MMKTHDQLKREKRTLQQIETAPWGALYIWPSSDLNDALVTAALLQRTDLIMVYPSWLDDIEHRTADPAMVPPVVIDNATVLTPHQWSQYDRLEKARRRKKAA